jgi:hypothetical protein
VFSEGYTVLNGFDAGGSRWFCLDGLPNFPLLAAFPKRCNTESRLQWGIKQTFIGLLQVEAGTSTKETFDS